MEVEFDLNDLQNIEDEDINEVIELLSTGEVNGNFLQWAEERQLENLRGIMIDTCEVIQVHLRGIGSELAAILNDTDLRSRFHIFRALLNIAKILVDMPTTDELKVDLPSLNPVFKNNISNGIPIDPQIEKLRQALSKFQMCLSEVVAKVSSINDYAYRTTSLAHANGASKLLKEVWDELSPIRESLSISPIFLNEKDETTVQKLSDASESDQSYYAQEEKSPNSSKDTLRNRKESMGENLNLLHTTFDKERARASTMMIRPKSAMMMNEIPQEKPDQIITPSQTTNPRSSLVPPLNLSVPPTAGSIEGSSSSNINPSPHSNNENIIPSTSSTTTTTTTTTPSTTNSPPKRSIDIEVTLSFQKTPTIATSPAQTKGKEKSTISLNDVSVSVADKKEKKKPKKKSGGCSCFGGGAESDEEEIVVKLDSQRETSPRNAPTPTIIPTLTETPPGQSPRKESIPLHKQLPTLRSGSISSQSPDAKILRNLKQDSSSGSLKIKTSSPTASVKQKTLHSFVAKSRIPLKDTIPVEELPIPACIFGTPLQDLERREDGGFVPQFLHKATESISQLSSAQLDEALNDVFVTIETHKESINAGNPLSASPKECIALIKTFLSDLPQPLLCYQDSSYEDYISLDPIEDLNWKLSHLKSLLFSLPLSHFTLTQFILKFLHSLAFSGTEDNSESGNQKDGRVPLARLGDVFGPVMLRQKLITAEHLSHRARVSSLLIEHSPYLTKMDDPDLTFTPKQQGQGSFSIVIHSATLPKLVERLADPFYKGDPDFTKMILLAFTYFTTARELLLSIISLYFKKWGAATKWENKHHQRILFVFNLWLQRDTLRLRDDVDFKLALSNFLHETPEGFVRPQTERPHFMFIEQWLKKNPLPVEVTQDERKSRRLSRMPPGGLSNNHTISDNDLDEIIVPTKEEFFERDDTQIAEQMAYIDNKLFRSIKSSEFLHKNFENRTSSPCFTAMMNKFNEWGHWVASEIVSTPEVQSRAKMISKFVRVAQKCLELQAFNTAYAIVAGLGNASVQRLKQTWALVSKETMAVYTSLQTVFDMSLNYRNYRTLLSESPSPLIPYLGLYPKDLFGIEENKATFFSPGVVNVGKLRNLYEIIHPLVDYQLGKNYSIKIEPDLNSFLSFHLKVLSQDEVYKHSLLCEPRVQHAIP